jgi:uncharacterized protein (DUF433 family)
LDWNDRIEIAPGRLGGKPVVRGSRISVELVVEMLADGWSEERVLESYPALTLDDVCACLGYAATSASSEELISQAVPEIPGKFRSPS